MVLRRNHQSLTREKIIYSIEVKCNLGKIKPIHAKWLLSLYDYLRVKEGMIINGFKQAGVEEALTIELEPQNPFYDLL